MAVFLLLFPRQRPRLYMLPEKVPTNMESYRD